VSRFTSGPYSGATDLPSLIEFAQRVTAAEPDSSHYYHPGDFVWQLAPISAPEDACLWFDEDRVVACAILEPPISFQYDIEPTRHDELFDEVLDWVEERHLGAAPGAIPRAYAEIEDALSTWMIDGDARRGDALARRGYVNKGESGVGFALRLDGRQIEPALPPGAIARHVGQADIAERIDLHRDAWSVWGESSFSAERYDRIREAPLYDPSLDVVVEFEGRLVSYCICWVDEVNRIGHFEPVGTRPGYARRGFGRAAIREGLRRLQACGMSRATVNTATVNPGAQALYRSAGFSVVRQEYWCSKPAPSGDVGHLQSVP
jgi:ribosomal protein S18 acetylase RimI-like enzyme